MEIPNDQKRVWFVTGASTGFGRAMVETVLSKGEIVVATLRTPSMLKDLAEANKDHNRLLILRCDVLHTDEISDAFRQTIENYGRCDVVFNNAGFAIMAETESKAQDKAARQMFDVNFWGAAEVMREAVRVFRSVNPPGVGGHLLNMSSVVGIAPCPAMSFYCASKHALEGLTTSMAKELDPDWNIKITLLEPGAFGTAGITNIQTFPAPAAYHKPELPSQKRRQFFNTPDIALGNARVAVQRFYQLTTLVNPPLHFPLGMDAVDAVRESLQVVSDDLNKYEDWSLETSSTGKAK